MGTASAEWREAAEPEQGRITQATAAPEGAEMSTIDEIMGAIGRHGDDCIRDADAASESFEALRDLIAAALAEARREGAEAMRAESAGCEHAIGHLSALVETQRLLLVDVEDICGRDGHGGQFEDGESEIIDRVRAHLATMSEHDSHPTPALNTEYISDRLVAISSAISDLDDRKAQGLLRETLQMLATLPETLSLPTGPRQAALLTDEQIEDALCRPTASPSWLLGSARAIEAAVLAANGLEVRRG